MTNIILKFHYRILTASVTQLYRLLYACWEIQVSQSRLQIVTVLCHPLTRTSSSFHRPQCHHRAAVHPLRHLYLCFLPLRQCHLLFLQRCWIVQKMMTIRVSERFYSKLIWEYSISKVQSNFFNSFPLVLLWLGNVEFVLCRIHMWTKCAEFPIRNKNWEYFYTWNLRNLFEFKNN